MPTDFGSAFSMKSLMSFRAIFIKKNGTSDADETDTQIRWQQKY